MKHLTALLLLAAAPATTEVARPQHNVLTAEERAAGWVLLFDGKTTSGWPVGPARSEAGAGKDTALVGQPESKR